MYEPKFSHDWDKRVEDRERRERLIRNVVLCVLGVTLAVTAYLGFVIVFHDEPEPVAGAVGAGETGLPPDAGSGGTVDEGQGAASGKEPMGAEVEPEAGEDVAGEPETAGAESGEDEPDTSPLFADDLVENDLAYVNLGEERNLFGLLVRYAGDLEDKAQRETLERIYELLREKKTARAFEEVSGLKAPARITEGTRAVVLTRMLRKQEAGKAYLEANRYVQPAEFHFEYGFYFMGARELRRAYTQFTTGVRKNPGLPALRFVAAGTAFDLGKWEEVIGHVDAVSEILDEIPAQIGLLAALSEVRTGQPAAAVERCRALLEDDPEAHDVRLFMARTLGALGRLREALEIYAELGEDKPEASTVQIEMARAYMASNQHDKALEVAAGLAGRKPDDVRIQAWYADILATNGKVDSAAAILEGMSDQLKGNEMALLQSLIAIRQEDYAGASEALEPYHTMDANLAMRWAGLRFRQGEAGTEVRDVLGAHQLNAKQWKAVADTAVRYEVWAMAAHAYERAMKAGDQSVVTVNNWAWSAMQNPDGFDAERIIEACEQALVAAPGHPNILETCGQALLKSDQAGRCMELLIKNSAVTEKSAELSLLQARCYMALKAAPSAVSALERCLTLMEDAGEWHLERSREEIEELLASLKR